MSRYLKAVHQFCKLARAFVSSPHFLEKYSPALSSLNQNHYVPQDYCELWGCCEQKIPVSEVKQETTQVQPNCKIKDEEELNDEMTAIPPPTVVWDQSGNKTTTLGIIKTIEDVVIKNKEKIKFEIKKDEIDNVLKAFPEARVHYFPGHRTIIRSAVCGACIGCAFGIVAEARALYRILMAVGFAALAGLLAGLLACLTIECGYICYPYVQQLCDKFRETPPVRLYLKSISGNLYKVKCVPS